MQPSTSVTIGPAQSERLLNFMTSFKPGCNPEGVYGIQVEPGVAMLVETLNDHAYVFVPPATIHRFQSAPGSGTDYLRKRIEASLFFVALVENVKRAQSDAGIVHPRSASRSPSP